MIIYLTGADFSTNKIGTINTWSIFTSLGSGATYSGPTYVDKNAELTATVTIADGYEIGSAGISLMMGSTDMTDGNTNISGNTISISIGSVTGNVTIKVPTVNTSTGEEDSGGSGGTTWYINSLDAVAATGKDVTGGTIFTGSSIAPVAFDNTFNAKLVGKTIDTVEIVPEKAGTITFGLYNTTTYAYTEKASITVAEADLNTRKIYTFTPFTVSSGELFTYYKSGDVGCMSYYLAEDVSGVDYCKGLQTKCNGAAPSAFNYDIITLINVGTSSGSSGGDEPTTPTNATWYINSLTQAEDAGTDISSVGVKLTPNTSYAWAFQDTFNNKLAGQTINTIRMFPFGAGTFHIGVFDPSTNTVTDSREFTVAESDINTSKTYTFSDLTIPSGKYFVWNNTSDQASEAVGYYVLKDKLDPLAVETCGWYQAKSTGLTAFGTHLLIFCADIGYVPQ